MIVLKKPGICTIIYYMKKNIFLMMQFLCFFAFAASSSKAPEWVLNCENVYPPENFFSAEGTGDSAEAAKSMALTNLSYYFKTKMSSVRDVNYKQYFKSAEGRSVVEKEGEITGSSKIDVDVELNSVEFTEPWRNKKEKKWHCLAFIERESLWNQYEPELRASRDSFAGFFSKASKVSEPFEKIRLLQMSRIQGLDFLEKLSYAEFLSSKRANEKYGQDIKPLAELPGMIQGIKNQNPVYIHVSQDSGNAVYSAVSQIVTELGFAVVKDRKNAGFDVEVDVSLENYMDSDIYVYSPAVQVNFSGSAGSLYVYSKDCEKVKVYTESRGVKKCIQLVSDALKNDFSQELKSALGEGVKNMAVN